MPKNITINLKHPCRIKITTMKKTISTKKAKPQDRSGLSPAEKAWATMRSRYTKKEISAHALKAVRTRKRNAAKRAK